MTLTDEVLLQRLVEIESPTGHEEKAVRFMQDQAREDGLVVEEDDVGNFIATAGKGSRVLLFVGHIDTVPGVIPVRVEQGKLWGRGSVDAKGALAAAYCAARSFVDHDDIQVRIVGAVDEEGASRGAQALPSTWRPEWIIIGEPSGAAGVTLGYKGILRGRLVTRREVSHGAGPDSSSADALLDAWRAVRERFAFEASFDAVQGRMETLETGNDGFWEHATGSFQLRLPPSMSVHQAQDTLQQIADGQDAELTTGEAIEAAVSSRRSPLVAAFTSAIRNTHDTPRLLRKTGTADFNLLAGVHPGAPMVAYGPGDSALDHRPDERLPLVEFQRSIEVLEQVFQRFAISNRPTSEATPQQAG